MADEQLEVLLLHKDALRLLLHASGGGLLFDWATGDITWKHPLVPTLDADFGKNLVQALQQETFEQSDVVKVEVLRAAGTALQVQVRPLLPWGVAVFEDPSCRAIQQYVEQHPFLGVGNQQTDSLLSHILYCVANEEGFFTQLNATWVHVLGWTLEELKQKPWFEFVHPDDLEATSRAAACLLTKGNLTAFQNRYRCRDGSYVWLDWEVYFHPEDLLVYGAAQLLGSHKAEVLEKHHLDERLEKWSAEVPAVVYQYLLKPDGSSCFPYASEGIKAIYGVSPEEVKRDASLVFDRLHPDDLARVQAEIKTSAETLTLFQSRFRVCFADGIVSWRKCDARPERLTNGSTLWYGIITDISQEVALQNQLALSERKLKHTHDLFKYVIENASSAVVVFDLNMRYLFVSERFKREYGLVGQSLEGVSHYEKFPHLPEHIKQAHDRANRGEVVTKREDHFQHADGSITYTSWECRPWYNEAGEVGGHILYLEIITEKKAAEMALQRSNDYLEGLIHHANAPIITWDANDRITRFNQAFALFSGYTSEEVLGKPLSVLFSAAIYESLQQSRANHERLPWESLEIQILCKDGQVRTALWNSANMYAADGETLVETIAQGQDISDRIKSAQALQAAVNRMQLLQNALDQVPVHVYMKNLDSTYFYANQLALRLFGIEAADLQGKADTAFFSEETAHALRQIDLKVFAGAQSVEQMDVADAQGNLKTYIEVKTPIIDPHQPDKVLGLVGFSTDITETTQHLRRIEALLKVEEAQNERLRNFTHIVSHNLRSHIANMLGIISLLDLEDPDLAQSTYIQTIRESANHLNETIKHLNEVLDINLKGANDLQALSLNRTVEQTISSIGQLAKNADVEIQNQLTHAFMVKAVPAYLDSIVLNMLTNAIKFKDAAKKSYIRIEAKVEEGMLLLSFADNGLGIDLEKHGPKLFGMYKTFHGHPDSKGLGLFITKNQVEAIGGKIWVSSEVGKGTTFFVSLPLAKE